VNSGITLQEFEEDFSTYSYRFKPTCSRASKMATLRH
jgi:hypothetical protein